MKIVSRKIAFLKINLCFKHTTDFNNWFIYVWFAFYSAWKEISVLDIIRCLNVLAEYCNVLISEEAYLHKNPFIYNRFGKILFENYILTFKYQTVFFDMPSWSLFGITQAFEKSLIEISMTILPHVFRN